MLINAYSLFFLNNFEENNENKFGFINIFNLPVYNFFNTPLIYTLLDNTPFCKPRSVI